MKRMIAIWSTYSCGSIVVLEQASESLVTLNGAAVLFGFIASIREKQLVAFTLMVAFAVIMRAELLEARRTSLKRLSELA